MTEEDSLELLPMIVAIGNRTDPAFDPIVLMPNLSGMTSSILRMLGSSLRGRVILQAAFHERILIIFKHCKIGERQGDEKKDISDNQPGG